MTRTCLLTIRLTPEELAARPVHMRQARECVTTALTYELTTSVDGQVLASTRVRPAGLRGDRPLSVEEEFAVTPGEHAVAVRFAPSDVAESGAAVLAFDGVVRFERGRVVLITQEAGRLRTR